MWVIDVQFWVNYSHHITERNAMEPLIGKDFLRSTSWKRMTRMNGYVDAERKGEVRGRDVEIL